MNYRATIANIYNTSSYGASSNWLSNYRSPLEVNTGRHSASPIIPSCDDESNKSLARDVPPQPQKDQQMASSRSEKPLYHITPPSNKPEAASLVSKGRSSRLDMESQAPPKEDHRENYSELKKLCQLVADRGQRKKIDIGIFEETISTIKLTLDNWMDGFDSSTSITIPAATTDNDIQVLVQILYGHATPHPLKQLASCVSKYNTEIILNCIVAAALLAWIFMPRLSDFDFADEKFLIWYRDRKATLANANLSNTISDKDNGFLDITISQVAAGFAARLSRVLEALLPGHHVFLQKQKHFLVNIFEAGLRLRVSCIDVDEFYKFLVFPPGTPHGRGDLINDVADKRNQIWRITGFKLKDIDGDIGNLSKTAIMSTSPGERSCFWTFQRIFIVQLPASSRRSRISETPEPDFLADDRCSLMSPTFEDAVDDDDSDYRETEDEDDTEEELDAGIEENDAETTEERISKENIQQN